MLLSLVLLALVSSSIAAPTGDRSTSLAARGRPYRDLDTAWSSPESRPNMDSLQSVVDWHFKIIKPDLNQGFDEWKKDIQAEYSLRRKQYYIEGEQSLSERFDSEVAAVLATPKAERTPSSEKSHHTQELYFIWILERLSLLQTDTREDVYKLMLDWSNSLHKRCDLQYTPYPAGLVSVVIQVQTLVQWRDWDGNMVRCPEIAYVVWNEETLALHQALSPTLRVSHPQLPCSTTQKESKSSIGDVKSGVTRSAKLVNDQETEDALVQAFQSCNIQR